MSEREFQDQVLKLARLAGWRSYHTHDSRRSDPGWPDLVLVRPPELVIVELKTDKGKLRPEQKDWLAWLLACGVETWVWRPGDWDHIVERLTSPAPS